MDKKEFFFKDAEIISKELETKIEKAELHAIKKKEEIDEQIELMKQNKAKFDKDLEELKKVSNEDFEKEYEAFKKKYNTENLVDELDAKFTEFAEKTKYFLNDLGEKVSSFYHKQKEKIENLEKPEKL
ncbi:MAG: hypothetical protein GXO49_07955 [Chlorobi bacterium]|nr:hypothetical protein [Chlorobiota bacterium]